MLHPPLHPGTRRHLFKFISIKIGGVSQNDTHRCAKQISKYALHEVSTVGYSPPPTSEW